MTELETRYSALFNGLNRAYGQWSKLGPKTIRGEVPDEAWINHLSGKIGLGVIPIRDDNTCVFGAIDIDIHNIDHVALAKKVEAMSLPLLVCRSKRGGAHCYTFTQPIKAAALRAALSRFAGKLGYGKAEIFPKQNELKSKDDIGNWINLPYFSAYSIPERYCITSDSESLTLVEFVGAAEALVKASNLTTEVGVDEMPPCLRYFVEQGGSEGSRNEVLYNFGVFYKKSMPDTWEDELLAINYKIFDKPLPNKEVQTLIKSLARKDYYYKCKNPPISDFCDSITCKTLPFGIGAIDDEPSKYGELMIGSITKIMTKPPRWVVEVNGIDIEFTTEEVMDYRKVRILCMEKVDMIAPPMRQEDWLKILKERIATKRTIEAPSDANQNSHIEQALQEFLQMADRSKDRQDIIRGLPVKTSVVIKTFDEVNNTEFEEEKNAVVFRSHDFIGYMRRKKLTINITGPALWMELRKMGCNHTKIRVGHRTVQIWYVLPMEDKSETTASVERLVNSIGDPEI